jgi:hypothetical protein
MKSALVVVAIGLYVLLALAGCSVVEAMMGHDEETRIIYDANDRVLAIEGYTPPEPTGALKEAIEAQEKLGQPAPVQK